MEPEEPSALPETRSGGPPTKLYALFLAALALVGLLILLTRASTLRDDIHSSDGSRRRAVIDLVIRPGESIRLGTLLTLSGRNESLGRDSQQGAVLAAALRGPVLGRAVHFVHDNDECSSRPAAVAARRLVREGVVAVVGPSCSSAADPARGILGRAKILLVSPSASSPVFTDPGTSYFARTVHNDRLEGNIAAMYARSEYAAWRTAAIITEDTHYSRALAAAFAGAFEDHGGSVVTRTEVEEPSEAERAVHHVRSQDPDVVYAPVRVRSGAAITRAVRQLLPESDLVLSSAVFTPDWIEAAGPENAEGVYVSVPDLTEVADPRLYEEEFWPEYAKAFGEEPQSVFHAHAFDAVNLILDTLEKVAVRRPDGTLGIGRTAFRDAFFSIRGHRGVSGTYSCTPAGDCREEQTFCIRRVTSGDDIPWCETVRLR
jgi:branched-chain amino acid transport system substrate-binding protein